MEPTDEMVKVALDEYLRAETAGKLRAMASALRAALAMQGSAKLPGNSAGAGEPKRMLMTHPHDGHGRGDTCFDCEAAVSGERDRDLLAIIQDAMRESWTDADEYTNAPFFIADALLQAGFRRTTPTPEADARMVIYANSNTTRGKFAAAAVHAALTATGAHHGGPVIVLGAKPSQIAECRTVIHDAGLTEVEPGTITAGTNWPTPEKGGSSV